MIMIITVLLLQGIVNFDIGVGAPWYDPFAHPPPALLARWAVVTASIATDLLRNRTLTHAIALNDE